MNWYQGNIAEAVAQSKAKNAIFVVYIEGKDEATEKLTKFLNEQKIRTKLESDDFVAIKIDSTSQAYMQFASIYQVVPVPSIFFIGKSGSPLEIGTAVIQSVDMLDTMIDKVVASSGKSTPVSSVSSTSLIQAEQASQEASVKAASVEPTSSKTNATKAKAEESKESEEVVCDGDVCYKRSNMAVDNKAVDEKKKETKSPTRSRVEAGADVDVDVEPEAETKETVEQNAQIEETRKLLEQKRRERIELEKKAEKDRELQRRREGKEMQNLQQWQKEHEFKELKENIRRERLEEKAARERIRAQIAADRAERAQKFGGSGGGVVDAAAVLPSSSNTSLPSKAPATAPDSTRLQFRFSTGNTATQTFKVEETLSVVRSYVKTELLPGTGIRDFILATTYPKREFTTDEDTKSLIELGLYPSAVILVIGKESSSNPSAMITRSGGLINMLSTLFMTLLSPVFIVFDYFKKLGGGGGGGGGGVGVGRNANGNESGTNKRTNEERGAQHEAAKRRNLERFGAGTSAAANDNGASAGGSNSEQKPYRRYGSPNVHRLTDNRKDSDDENATWNGNSTQQQ